MKTLCKMVFIISALIFLFVFLTAPKTDCEACFDRGGKFDKFMKNYEEVCLQYEAPSLNYNLTNVSVINHSKS